MRIKVVIIIVLKLDSMIDTREGLSYGLKGSTWIDWVNIRTKSNYYYIFKTQLGGRLEGNAWITSWEGQLRLIWVNVWTKNIIIIILKSNSRVDLRRGLDHGLRWSTRVYQKKYKKGIKAISFPPKKDSNKSQRVFGLCFILGYLWFLTELDHVNHFSIFFNSNLFKSRANRILDQFVKPTLIL